MKLNENTLKSLVYDLVKQDQVILEAPQKPKYDRVIDMLRDADYGSVALMSGQYPMGKASDLSIKTLKQFNAKMKADLEEKISKLGLQFERIGGSFGPNIEQSVLIWDPSQKGQTTEKEHMLFLEKIEDLNRQFTQWGFVGGKRITAGADGNADYEFTMYKIDYESEYDRGFRQDPDSKTTSIVLGDEDLQDRDSGFSFIPKSGAKKGASQIGKKFGIPLYERMYGVHNE